MTIPGAIPLPDGARIVVYRGRLPDGRQCWPAYCAAGNILEEGWIIPGTKADGTPIHNGHSLDNRRFAKTGIVLEGVTHIIPQRAR